MNPSIETPFDSAESERLLDKASAMLRERLTEHSAVAAGRERADGLILIAIAIRDTTGVIDLELWKVPAAGFDLANFVDQLENGSLQ